MKFYEEGGKMNDCASSYYEKERTLFEDKLKYQPGKSSEWNAMGSSKGESYLEADNGKGREV